MKTSIIKYLPLFCLLYSDVNAEELSFKIEKILDGFAKYSSIIEENKNSTNFYVISRYEGKAYKVVKQINFSSSDISKMANYVKTDGLEVTVAVQQWLKDHEQKWQQMPDCFRKK